MKFWNSHVPTAICLYRLHYIITSTIDRKKYKLLIVTIYVECLLLTRGKVVYFLLNAFYVFRQRSNKNTQKKNVEHGVVTRRCILLYSVTKKTY